MSVQSKWLPWSEAALRALVVPRRCMSSASQSSASYFDLLGVAESASLEEIKAAFRAKSKLLHPDVNKAPTASRDFMLLRRAYTTLSTAELRAEYEAKLGMPSARARDPRFARFERWRREVIPDLRIQLDYWSRGLDGYLAAWRASLERREQHLARLHRACGESLQQLQQLRNTTEWQPPIQTVQGDHPSPSLSQQQQPQQQQQRQQSQQQQSQRQQDAYWLYSEEDGSTSAASAADVEFTGASASSDGGGGAAAAGVGGSGGDSGGGSGSCTAQNLVAEAEAALRNMAAEVAGIESDSGDGTARVEREVEKRYQQVSMRYPAYPDIVWMDVWEETSEQWLAQSAAEAQRCAEAGSRWTGRLRQLQERLQAAMPAELHGQIAAAGTGRFNGTYGGPV